MISEEPTITETLMISDGGMIHNKEDEMVEVELSFEEEVVEIEERTNFDFQNLSGNAFKVDDIVVTLTDQKPNSQAHQVNMNFSQ